MLEGRNNATRGSKEARNPVIRGIFVGERPGGWWCYSWHWTERFAKRGPGSRKAKRIASASLCVTCENINWPLKASSSNKVWDRSRCKRAKRFNARRGTKRKREKGKEELARSGSEPGLHKRNSKVDPRTLLISQFLFHRGIKEANFFLLAFRNVYLTRGNSTLNRILRYFEITLRIPFFLLMEKIAIRKFNVIDFELYLS